MQKPCARRDMLLVVCGLLFAVAGPARGNDSGSELASGGIVLVKSDAIAMQREDLSLSPAEVRVRYEMRNDSGKPLTLRVAFPLPEVPAVSPGGRTTTTGGYNILMTEPREANFLGFRVWADQREVMPEVEIRSTLPDGRNIAEQLQQIGGMALVLRSGYFFPPDDGDLDAATRKRLAELGAIETLDDRGYRLPWTTRITFHWLQTFAPGITVIEHSYRPILGFRLVTVDKGGAVIASGSEDTASAFCIDAAGKRTLRQMSERALARRQKEGGGADSYLFAYTLGYVLQTARNWRGPIGTFNLTVTGGPIPMVGSTDTRMTGAVSFCSEVPVKQAAARRLEGMAPDFVPRQDLRILFIAE
jgi:hypothetical protein